VAIAGRGCRSGARRWRSRAAAGRLAPALIASALLLGACGGSGSPAAGAQSATSAAAAGVPAAARKALVGRLPSSGELLGLVPAQAPEYAASAVEWVAGEEVSAPERQRNVRALERASFIAGARERLIESGASNNGALEGAVAILYFKSPFGASAEFTFQGLRAQSASKTFTTRAIPGAFGYESLPGAARPQIIVMSSVGHYFFSLTVSWQRTVRHPPTRTSVVAGAQALNRRLTG
jgi:hypothetical protein